METDTNVSQRALSGESRARGSGTKTGNTHARRVLVRSRLDLPRLRPHEPSGHRP